MPSNYKQSLGELMAGWLSNTRAVAGSSQFFLRSEKFGGTEVDGSQLTAGDIFTVLTLANNFSKNHLMGIHTFSLLRDWLERVEPNVFNTTKSDQRLLLEFVREYCSLAVRQCLKSAQQEHDKTLQKAVLCEVMHILSCLINLDPSQRMQCLLIVKRIQGAIIDKFRSDPHDVSILVQVMSFHLNFGETTDTPEPFYEQFLNDIVQRSYSSGMAAFDIASLLISGSSKLQPLLISRFFPNLLKLVACHPAALVEEYIELVPLFVEPHTVVEVFFSLADLPLMSATLSLHQVSIILLQERSTSLSPTWASLLENIRTPVYRSSYNHMLRNESNAEEDSLPTRAYIKLFSVIANHPLFVTCAQIVPLLLDAFFNAVQTMADEQIYIVLLQAIMKKLRLVFNVPGYQNCLYKSITDHLQGIFQQYPGLVFALQVEITQYISLLDNSDTYPHLYIHLMWCIGAYASRGHSELCTSERILKYFEIIECVLYEMLARITSEEKISLNLLNVTSSTLAKLASRCQDLIPRLLLCFSKVQRQVCTKLQNVSEDDKQVVHDRIDELISFLRNPNIASPSVILSSSHELNPALTTLLQVLAQVTDPT